MSSQVRASREANLALVGRGDIPAMLVNAQRVLGALPAPILDLAHLFDEAGHEISRGDRGNPCGLGGQHVECWTRVWDDSVPQGGPRR